MSDRQFITRTALLADLAALGVAPGDALMVHAAVSRVGAMLGGPDDLISALMGAVGPDGVLLGYADWNAKYDDLLDASGRLPAAWRRHAPAFEPATSRCARDNGVFPEFLRTTPGALRSGNPGASVVALGARAATFTEDHPINYGYGEDSPFARLIAANGKVAMIGAPLETMTLLHHAEHLARIPGKRVRRYEAFLRCDNKKNGAGEWRLIEEFETGEPVVDGLRADYFEDVVNAYLETGRGARGSVGGAGSVLVDAADIAAFATDWLEKRFGDKE